MMKLRACILLLFCAAVSASAQTFTTVFSFDGQYPGPLIQGLDGNLYGNTEEGGSNSHKPDGTAYKLTPTGTLTSLYSFCSRSHCADGNEPGAGLVLSADGNFYGTTNFGGGLNGTLGFGTVFKITQTGDLKVLYDFCSQPNCEDGEGPISGLLLATDGNFYGTTQRGGGVIDDGTIFKITPGGVLTTLYSFGSTFGANGISPNGLTQGADGNFYGTTSGGALGYGTVFKLSLPDDVLTMLYAFCAQANCTDGSYPNAALIQASDGNLYGTTREGGTNALGTIFKVTPGGTLTTLYSFCAQANCEDGAYPQAPLIQMDGNFYGTTNGQIHCCATLFRFSSGGTLTTLHTFSSNEGFLTGLMQATSGYLYGATSAGGTSGDGTVFSMSVGLSPFIETLPASSKAGVHVIILGNSLTGSTAVNFNGSAAAFTVVSDTEITATVPVGATSGFVTVTTPSGTLKSNKPFRVIP
jgi:uncharacterized repeat protein (TIGR03803 family)